MRCLWLTVWFVAAVFAAPGHAQLQYFGKNKVQYRDQEWRVLETRHFELHFYEHEAGMVHDAARLAEQAYTQISSVLGHEVSRQIPIVLYASHSDFQQTHITPSMIDVGTGGITDLARRRVFLPFNGSWGDFQHVLTHELVHAFEIDMLFDGSRSDPLNPFSYSAPLWVMEGLAEYLSRPKQDTYTAMWLRDAALSGHLIGLEQLEQVYDIRVYRLGQSVFAHFAELHGTRRIGDLLRAIAEYRSMDQAFEVVAGVSLRQFSESWTTAVRRQNLPELGRHQLTREFSTPLVTRETENAGMLLVPSISPDGRLLVFVSDAGLTRDLHLRDLETGETRRLVHGERSGDFESLRFFSASMAWAPDSKTLAFVSQARGEDALNLVEVASGRVRGKYHFGLDELQTPTFSPDGSEIIFAGLSGGQSDLYRVQRDGTDLRRLTNDRFAERDPQWSPDGRSVVFVTDAGSDTDFDALRFGAWKLQLLDLEAGTRRPLAPFVSGNTTSPAWSGDGSALAFISDQDGIANIYILTLATGNVFRVTDSVTGIGGVLPVSPALSWARGTDRLVFSAFGEAGWDIYRLDRPMRSMQPLHVEPEPAPVSPPVVATSASGVLGMHRIASLEVPVAAESTITAGTAAAESTITAGTAVAESTITSSTPTPAAGLLLPEPLPENQFIERRYRARLAPDVSHVGGVVGTQGGIGGASLIHFSDLLGDHVLSVGFGIYGSLKDSDLLVEYLNRSNRINYQLGVFQHQRRYGYLMASTAGVERQTYMGVRGVAIRPFDKFSRCELSMQVSGVRGSFFLGETDGVEALQEIRTFVGPGLAYVVDTALFGITGPIMGRRMRLGFESGFGELDFRSLELDLRQYWSFGPSFTVAARGYLANSWGKTPQTYFMGGAYTLRGYSYGALAGNHASLASVEFRFPLLRYLALGWPLPLELGNVRGALFAEGASAWDGEFLRSSRATAGHALGLGPQMAFGFGTRLNLGAYVLRIDWAHRYDAERDHLSRATSVSIGADF